MAKTFVISDTHFNHAGILDFKDYIGKPCREFDSIEQMNECMLDNWVSVVGPKDTVIHCGDVLFGMDKADWMELGASRLQAAKIVANLKQQVARTAASCGQKGDSQELVAQLTQLNTLYQDGCLTDAEFIAAKAKLLHL